MHSDDGPDVGVDFFLEEFGVGLFGGGDAAVAHQFAEQVEGYAVVNGQYSEAVTGGVHCGHLLEAQGHADCVQGDVECAVFGVAVFVELGLVGDVVVFGEHVEDEAFVASVAFPAFEDFEGGG